MHPSPPSPSVPDLSDYENLAHLSSPLALGPHVIPNFRQRAHQKVISDAIVDAITKRGPRFIAVSLPQQFGKALALDTPIATPAGWTTIGDIQPGDEVFDDQGYPTKVVGITSVQLNRPCYAMLFDDREVIVADAEHEWLVNLNRAKAHIDDYFLRTTERIAKGRGKDGRHGTGRNFEAKIRRAKPLQLPWIPFSIPPYTLGLWLGDGASSTGSLTSHPDDRDELRCFLQEDGFVTRVQPKSRLGWTVEGLHRRLKAENLLNNKHIPAKYFRASESQRWALLQGLVDSDGYVNPRNGHVEFCTTKEELAEGMMELARSLGMKPMMNKDRATLRKRDIGPRWRIHFYHPNAARLYRKRVRCRMQVNRRERYAKPVEVPSVPVKCIKVAAESGMFLAGKGMVPTHNSLTTSILTPLYWLELFSYGVVPGGLVGIVSYEDSLSMTWSQTIRRTIAANPSFYASTLRKDSKAAGFWETEEGGGILALGVGGAIQGRPLSLFVIDDVVKNWEQAASERQRDTIWNWWTSVALGRLQPWTIVLVVQVRWREDDFIGRLLSPEYEGNPDHWRYIRIPAVCDSDDDPVHRKLGDALFRPQADYSQQEANSEMEFVKESVSTYSWSTMWQQNPVDPEGTIFFEKHWRYWGGDSEYKLPKHTDFEQMIFSWDMTYKDKKENDWVVGQFWGGVGADRYLIDQVRGHWGFTETSARVKSFAEKWRRIYPKATGIVVEDKANGPAVMDALRSSVGGLIEFDPRDYGDKVQRAWACQPLLLGGNLYIPAHSERPFVREFLKEMSDFPRAAHDDVVDSCTMALLAMAKYRIRPSTLITATATDLQNVRALGGFTRRR